MRRILSLIVLAGTSSAASVPIQVLPSDRPSAPFWVPNQAVQVLAEREGILYVGGGFDRVGPHCGPMAVLDAFDGRLVSGGFPAVAGVVHDIEPDGAGGWFVAGTFEQVGDRRREGVVRFDADGSLHDWDPDVRGTVRALLRVGPTLYMAGQFDVAQGARVWLAAVDVETAALRPWDTGASNHPPDQFRSPDILLDLALMGNAILIGGYFSDVRIGGTVRSHLAAVDAVTGAAQPCPVVNGTVAEIVSLGTSALIAGEFTTVNGIERRRLARIGGRRVLPSKFPAPDRGITAMGVAGKTAYIGGSFNSVGGSPRSHLAAIDLVSGRLLPWAPSLEDATATGEWVEGLAALGSTVYVAGGFHRVSGEARQSLAAIERTSGDVLPWDPRVASEPRLTFVQALAVDGGHVAAGGNFTAANTVRRLGLAAYDLSSGELLPWAPEVQGVHSLAFDGPRIFVGGTFSEANGVSRPRLAVVDADTGELDLAFDAHFCHNSGSVSRLVFDGQRLFGAGCVYPCGQSCRSLWVLDPYTGTRVPGIDPFLSSNVHDMQLSEDGTTLYLGGSFLEVGDPFNGFQARARLAALDTTTGLFTDWAPAAQRDVDDLLLDAGRLFMGGAFESLGGEVRPFAAEVDPFTGQPTTWSPQPDDPVSELATDGEIMYLFGAFDLVDGQFLPRLAAVDTNTGAVLDWVVGQRSGTGTLLLTERGLIVSGGPDFAKGVVHNLAVFEY